MDHFNCRERKSNYLSNNRATIVPGGNLVLSGTGLCHSVSSTTPINPENSKNGTHRSGMLKKSTPINPEVIGYTQIKLKTKVTREGNGHY